MIRQGSQGTRRRLSGLLVVCAAISGFWVGGVSAQSTGMPEEARDRPVDGAVAASMAQAVAMRDAVVAAISAAGFKCAVPPPTVIVQDVFSYGSYDEQANTLTVSAWSLLSEAAKARFFRVAGPGATEKAAQTEFETGVYHWVRVHEMGHWWQACQHVTNEKQPYAFEYGANRIAAAYWRDHDASVIAHQRGIFKYVLDRVPSPIAAGESSEAYFDAHYPDKFKSGPEYTWFQAGMCLKVFDETPAPSFAQALKDTKP